jgi:hypothetical protein
MVLPTSALRQEGQGTAVWVLDEATMTVNSQAVQLGPVDGNDVVVSSGLTPGQKVVSAGVHVLSPGQKVTVYSPVPSMAPAAPLPLHGDPMSSTDNTRFNLSRWALEHPALTRYLMVVLMVLGMASYFQLGQDEDPPFTFRAMVVRAYWPGATAEQVAEQVTDKIERTLQEVPFADKIRSYSKPGEAQIIFQIKDNSDPGAMCRRFGTPCAKRSATCVAACRRAWWGRFSTTNLAMCTA